MTVPWPHGYSCRCPECEPIHKAESRRNLIDVYRKTSSDTATRQLVDYIDELEQRLNERESVQQPELTAGKNPCWVECSKCTFKFIGAYFPMEMDDAAKVMRRMTCPLCACTKIYVKKG